MKTLRITLVLSFFLGVAVLFLPSVSHAAGKSDNYGLETSAQAAKYTVQAHYDNGAPLMSTITKIVSLALVAAIFIFFAFTVYAGIRWMTARGNDEFVKKAKDTLEASIFGLIVVVSAYAITTYIFTTFNTSNTPPPPAASPSNCSAIRTNGDCIAPCAWVGDSCIFQASGSDTEDTGCGGNYDGFCRMQACDSGLKPYTGSDAGQLCSNGGICCVVIDDSGPTCQSDADCAADESCSDGSCQSRSVTCSGADSTLCSGACVNTQIDNRNCGGCGNSCNTLQNSCQNGTCSGPALQ